MSASTVVGMDDDNVRVVVKGTLSKKAVCFYISRKPCSEAYCHYRLCKFKYTHTRGEGMEMKLLEVASGTVLAV